MMSLLAIPLGIILGLVSLGIVLQVAEWWNKR